MILCVKSLCAVLLKCNHTPLTPPTQILMTDLDPDIMALYSPVAYSSDKLLMQETGIDQIVPGATLDSKIFEPCGFSVNAIIKVSCVATRCDIALIFYMYMSVYGSLWQCFLYTVYEYGCFCTCTCCLW